MWIVLPGFYESAPQSLQKLLRADKSVEAYIKYIHGTMEKGQVTQAKQQRLDEVSERDEEADLKQVISEDYA